jgi:predicted nuclease with TOPRIM domain
LGKNTRGNKEYSREQELKHENEKLRNKIRQLEGEVRQLSRQHARTRKQFARMDLDRHAYVQEIVQEHIDKEKEQQSAQQILKSMKEEWMCRECGEGQLEISVYTRLDGTFYHRVCNCCPNRTKSQRYDPETVKGIMRKPKAKTEDKKKF